MLPFTERSVVNASGKTLFDITISGDGRYFTPGVSGNVPWKTRVRNGDGDYVETTNDGFGNTESGGLAHTRDNQYLFISNGAAIYRATKDGDTFPYDGWNIASGAPRAVATNADGSKVAAGVGNNALVWDVASKGLLLNQNTSSLVEDIAFSPDGTFLVSSSRAHGPSVYSVSGSVTFLAALGVGLGNWNIAWHPDSDHFVVSQYANGGSVGLHVFKKTGPSTFARLTSPFDDGGFAASVIGATYLGGSSKDYLLANAYGGTDTRLYRRIGDTYVRQTMTGFPEVPVEIMRGALDAPTVAFYSGYPASVMKVVDFGTPSITANGTITGPFSEISGVGGPTSRLTGEMVGPFADLSSEVAVGLVADGDLVGPFAELMTAVAVQEPGSTPTVPVRVFPAQVQETGVGASTQNNAAGTFAYGRAISPFAETETYVAVPVIGNADLEGPFADTSGLVFAAISGDAQLGFPSFAFAGTAGLPLTLSPDLSFPVFTIAGEGDNGIDGLGAGAALTFPRLVTDGDVEVPFAGEGEVRFLSFETDGFTAVPYIIETDIGFPKLGIDGLVGNFYLTSDGTFPKLGIDGLVGNFYLTSDGTFPSFGSDGLVGSDWLTAEATFPSLSADGLVGNYYAISETAFPSPFRTDGLIMRPDFIDANLRFPKFTAAGVVSFNNSVVAELSFPAFRVRGSTVDIVVTRAQGVSFGSASGSFSLGRNFRLSKSGSPFRMG